MGVVSPRSQRTPKKETKNTAWNPSAMGFSSVFRERVSETLGNRCCFRMFLFLFPVSVRIPPPPPLLPFFSLLSQNKVRPKIIILFSTSFQGQGHKGTEDDDVQSVHEAGRIVEQYPAHCVSVCVCVCVCVCESLLPWLPIWFSCVSTQSYKVVKGTSKSSTTEMRTVMRTKTYLWQKAPNSLGARCGRLI